MTRTRSHILPVIVIAQFFCTSLWFAGNAILPDLALHLHIPQQALGSITSAVQFGFIAGTLVYAGLLIADRFRHSNVFFVSALFAAISNAGIVFMGTGITHVLLMRFLTGFFLAGIYPVGMKIAADYYEKGLGKALGFLVGALVIGTAFPHLIKSLTAVLPWKTVLYFTSALSVTGGALMLLFVPPGPYQSKIQSLKYRDVFSSFKNKAFRSAAFGYFGHMWELYAFWAFVPVLLMAYNHFNPAANLNISYGSFCIIAAGGLACVASGYLSQKFGAKKTAFVSLLLSGCCCLFSPLAFYLPVVPFILFLIFWGLVVIADSPLFSSLVAQNAIATIKGTAITMVTCIGFSITIASIELLNYLSVHFDQRYMFLFLAIGPVAGLLCMLPKNKK
ncbi:MAG: MFS transporter [Ferruginibacter sp.]|nr:MFS transporter [Chitinophagaceae bacterium]